MTCTGYFVAYLTLTLFQQLSLNSSTALYNLTVFVLQKSSSSESLSEKGSSDLKKSFDAVVFDVLKVTPEQYAVSQVHVPVSGCITIAFQVCEASA